jgi:hypothetical protein
VGGIWDQLFGWGGFIAHRVLNILTMLASFSRLSDTEGLHEVTLLDTRGILHGLYRLEFLHHLPLQRLLRLLGRADVLLPASCLYCR